MNKEQKKHMIEVVAFAILLYCGILHLDVVWNVVCHILSLFMPFIAGGAIAFIFNVPMKLIEKHLFPNSQKFEKFRRILAYILTLVLVVGILFLCMVVIIPELIRTGKNLGQQITASFLAVQSELRTYAVKWPSVMAFLENSDWDISSLSGSVSGLLQSTASRIFSSGLGIISGFINGTVAFFIGIVFSVYILFQKEKLSCQIKKILYAFFSEQRADTIISIASLANRTFANFLSGQCLEACILGTMFVIIMSILKFPYAMLIGVIIALTALIPIVGAFVGCAVGMFLIVMVDPIQSIWFLILFLVLQQIEGNLIYPHVVGNSIGLPSMWVLVAVSVGGSLFGIWGILIFIPLSSVCYALFREFIHNRLKGRHISAEKYQNLPSNANSDIEE